MTISAATRRKLHATDDRTGLLALLEISGLSEPVRLVNDTRNITTLGHTWLALPFSVKLPNDVAKENGRAQLRVDNVGREFTQILENLAPSASLQATLRLVHRDTPGVVDYELIAPLSGVRTDMNSVTATIGHDNEMRRPAVALRFDPFTAPALFPD